MSESTHAAPDNPGHGGLARRADRLGPGFASMAHRHDCVQLLMTLRGSLLVRSGPEERGGNVAQY